MGSVGIHMIKKRYLKRIDNIRQEVGRSKSKNKMKSCIFSNTEVIYPSRCNAFLHFRSIDGTCNNLRNPTWGAAYEPYRRLAGHNYGDGG